MDAEAPSKFRFDCRQRDMVLRNSVRGWLVRSDFSCVYPVVQFGYPIWRCLDLAEDGTITRHWPEYENSRSQDLPKEYHDTGTFYWYKTKEWLSGNIKVGGIEVNETTIQDIDTETDWKLAEMKYRLLYGE